MAIKRLFNICKKSGRRCLRCDEEIPQDKLENDVIYKCKNCGQKHFVDIYEESCVLTVFEEKRLRPKRFYIQNLTNERLKRLIKEEQRKREYAEQDAEEWKAIAEGLIEKIEERIGDIVST